MATEVTVVMNDAAIAKFVGWSGPLGHSVERLARETVYRQGIYANRRTGFMASELHYVKKRYARGIGFWAGSKARYALYVDQGTQPHKILPKKPGGRLVFYWAKVGRVVALTGVNHPGTRAYKFLEKGLERALGVWNRSG